MMQHPGRVFSRSQLLDNVWGETIYIDERTVDVMSAGCARRSTTAACRTSSAPSAAPATRSARRSRLPRQVPSPPAETVAIARDRRNMLGYGPCPG